MMLTIVFGQSLAGPVLSLLAACLLIGLLFAMEKWRTENESMLSLAAQCSPPALWATSDPRRNVATRKSALEGKSILAQCFDDGRIGSEPDLVPRRSINAELDFGWAGSPRVGYIMTFTVTYTENDGTPHGVQAEDPVRIEIRHLEKSLEGTPLSTEIGFAIEPVPAQPWVQEIKFPVRKSGEYRIRVLTLNEDVPGSPFIRRFVAGRPEPSQSVLLRGTPPRLFVFGQQQRLTLETRDRFGNLCRDRDVDPGQVGLTFEHLDMNEEGKAYLDFVHEKSLVVAGRIVVLLELLRTGVLHGRLTYEGVLVRNGAFDLVVLNYIEADIVDKFWNSNRPVRSYSFDADLYEGVVPGRGQSADKENNNNGNGRPLIEPFASYTRKVRARVILSPKNLTVNRKFWKFFSRRVATGKITVHSKIKLLSVDPETDVAVFEFSDGLTPKLWMSMPASSLRVFMAIFSKQLGRKLGESESFSEKAKYFYEVIRRSKDHLHCTCVDLDVERTDIVSSARNATRHLNSRDWCRLFRINFVGEPAIDGGGVQREFFELLCSALFENSPQSLFCSFGNSRLVHPNPGRTGKWRGRPYERIWEMAGRVVGKCLYESSIGGCYKMLVKGRFTRSFLAQLLGIRPHYKYFEQDDPELYLGKIKYILENEVSSLDLRLTFTDEVYGSSGDLIKIVELIPGGSNLLVTEGNKLSYLNALAQYRLCTRVKTEVDLFLRGLNSIIPEDLLTIFDENELELLMCGQSTYSMEELKKYHRVQYDGCCHMVKNYKILDWFFTIVTNLSSEEKGRLLQFTTGSSLLPPGGLRRLVPPFTIEPTEELGRFPTAHTCANLLCLPDHPTFESFEKALQLAINEGCEGFSMM